MKISASKYIFYLFLLLPLTFKIEVAEGISFYPQELLLPVLVLLVFLQNRHTLPKLATPYIFYLGALLVVLLSTFISQLSFLDPGGILKTFKYIFYVGAILYLPWYSFDNFLSKFNKVAFVCILLTLLNYLFKFLTFEGSIADFINLSTWNIDYVPSGFSNSIFSLSELTFTRTTGNHGIYGSYLVLVYLVNFAQVLEKKSGKLFNKVMIVLAVGNLFLINSRESLLIFILVNLLFLAKPFLRFKLKLTYIYFLSVIVIGMVLLIVNNVNISLVQKITYTIDSFSKSGAETNISLRFGVWHLILLSFTLFPLHLLWGYGYNTPNFEYYLDQTNRHYILYSTYVTVPESIFFFFLAFGGIAALLLIVCFFAAIICKTYKIRNNSTTAGLFFYFVLGLFITNNTGGSLISDLLLAQFSLVYFWITKNNGVIKNTIHNSKG